MNTLRVSKCTQSSGIVNTIYLTEIILKMTFLARGILMEKSFKLKFKSSRDVLVETNGC